MKHEDDEPYLWDGSGAPDADVARLERLLARYRHVSGEPPAASGAEAPRAGTFARRWMAAAGLLLAGLLVVVYSGSDRFRGFRVEGPAGTARLAVGDLLETGADAATVVVPGLGDVVVAPGARIRAERTPVGRVGFYLERGRVSASIVAEPRVFSIGTPAGLTIDLGCDYDLDVDADEVATLYVRTGRVAFAAGGDEVIVPAGALCRSTPGRGPEVPLAEDAPPELVRAVRAIEHAEDPDPADVAAAIDAPDPREHSVTLWYLFERGRSPAVRDAALARLRAVFPLPEGVEPADVEAREAAALDAWRGVVAREWGWSGR